MSLAIFVLIIAVPWLIIAVRARMLGRSITILQIPTRASIGTRATRDPAGEFRDYISLFRMATRAPTPSYVCN